MNEELQNLISSNEHFKFDEDLQKVVCILTGHEMRPDLDIVQKYIKGKKFEKAIADKIFNDYKKFLTPAKNNQLYCQLTCRFINFKYDEISRHVTGFLFLRAAERWLKCKEENSEFKPLTKLRKKDLKKYKQMKNEEVEEEDKMESEVAEDDEDESACEDGTEIDSKDESEMRSDMEEDNEDISEEVEVDESPVVKRRKL